MQTPRLGITLGVMLLTGLLWGCGAISEKENPRDTDFVMISTGSASLIYKAFIGGVEYCKVTKHGIQHNDFEGYIEWDGKTCRIRTEVGDAQNNP